jgi:gamma-glutamylcysteine synthetase
MIQQAFRNTNEGADFFGERSILVGASRSSLLYNYLNARQMMKRDEDVKESASMVRLDFMSAKEMSKK